jgi:hypothetical protein
MKICVYTKTKATARKTGNDAYKFLRDKLKLSINREKSGIRRPVNFTTLGFGFVPTYVKGEKGKYQLIVADKSWEKLKQKLKRITRKTISMSFDERIQKLNEIQRGWAVAQSPILGTTITLERLSKRGYIFLLNICKQISPQLNEPLYTRPLRTFYAVKSRGVRGAPVSYLLTGHLID